MKIHVLVQGSPGLPLFVDDRDRRTMRDLLGSARGVGLLAFVPAKHAYHLVLRADGSALSRLLHDANRRYSRAYKERHGVSRPVFPGRTTIFTLPSPFWEDRTIRALAGLETPMEVWKVRMAWLLDWAEKRPADLGGESPRTIAVAWARESGIPPRAISEALGYASGHSVSVLLDSIRKRAKRDPGLRKAIGRGPKKSVQYPP